MRYVKGEGLKNICHLQNNDIFYNKFYSLYYLLNSIYLLNKIK